MINRSFEAERIEFNDITNRLRRNLLGGSFLIIALRGFGIELSNIEAANVKFANLTSEIIIILLLAFLFYHVIAFIIRALEEYQNWVLKLGSMTETLLDRIKDIPDFGDQIRIAAAILRDVIDKQKVNQNVLTAEKVGQLMKIAEAADVFTSQLRAFQKITRFRFWVLDIGAPVLLTTFAVLFAFSESLAGTLRDLLLL